MHCAIYFFPRILNSENKLKIHYSKFPSTLCKLEVEMFSLFRRTYKLSKYHLMNFNELQMKTQIVYLTSSVEFCGTFVKILVSFCSLWYVLKE